LNRLGSPILMGIDSPVNSLGDNERITSAG
jgi:hypothetical protein